MDLLCLKIGAEEPNIPTRLARRKVVEQLQLELPPLDAEDQEPFDSDEEPRVLAFQHDGSMIEMTLQHDELKILLSFFRNSLSTSLLLKLEHSLGLGRLARSRRSDGGNMKIFHVSSPPMGTARRFVPIGFIRKMIDGCPRPKCPGGLPAETALAIASGGASLRFRCQHQAQQHALQRRGCASGAALCQLW